MKQWQLISSLIFLKVCFALPACERWKAIQGVPNSYNKLSKEERERNLSVQNGFNFANKNYQPVYMNESSSENDRGLIIDGGSATMHEYPWYVQVVVTAKKLKGGESHFYCGGTIIGRHTVLTAAHCVHILDEGYQNHASKIELIYGGSAQRKYGGNRIHSWASHYHVHPDFLNQTTKVDPRGFQQFPNDMALVHFKEGFPCEDKNIHSIGLLKSTSGSDTTGSPNVSCFSSTTESSKDDSQKLYPAIFSQTKIIGRNKYLDHCTGFTIGMGLNSKVKSEQRLTARLMEISSDVLSCEDCNTNFRSDDSNLGARTTNVCTSTGKVASTWKGDSGGPMMIDSNKGTEKQIYVQAGLVSYGAETSVVTVYTSVASYESWIIQFAENKDVEFVNVPDCDKHAYSVGGGVGDDESEFIHVMGNWRTWVICIIFTFTVFVFILILKCLQNCLCPKCCKKETELNYFNQA